VRRADGQYIRLARLPYLVAAEADGESDFEQIAPRVSKDFGRTVSADIVRYLAEERLRPLGVLAATNGSSTMLPRAKLGVLALWFRTPMVPEGVVEAFTAVFRPLFFAPVVIVVLAGFAALEFWLFFIHGISWSTLVEALYRPENFLTVFGLGILAASFHELGHATACRYGGAKPGRIGAGIYLVWPVFYSDVTDAYRLSKAGRLRVDLGGVYFNAIFWLATAGAYFLTESEVLLIAVFFGQLAMLYQFMPFVRLDGYYVVSDLTGVPDLFARIKPTLRSMIPGRATDTRVLGELKPWVRVAVTAWVLITIPALIYLLARMGINAPFMYTTAWDSFLVNYDTVLSAFGEGKVVDGVAGLVRIVLLIIPVVGLPLLYALIGKRLSGALWSWLGGKQPLRAGPASDLLGTESRHEEELMGTESRHEEELKRAEEVYDGLVEEFSRHLRDLPQLIWQADLRRTELKQAFFEQRAKQAEEEYRRVAEEAEKAARAHEQARSAYIKTQKAARHAGLEARRLEELGDKEVRRLEELRQTAPDRTAVFNLGVLFEGRGEYDLAVEAYQQAIDSGHAEAAPRAAFDLGILFEERGEYDQAVEAYQQAIDSGHPEEAPRAAFNLGLMLDKQGEYDLAVKAYQQAIDSKDAEWAPKAVFNLGMLFEGRGEYDLAVEAYQQAIDSEDGDAASKARLNLGVLFEERGEYDLAEQAYQQAINSGHPEVAPEGTRNLRKLHMRLTARESSEARRSPWRG